MRIVVEAFWDDEAQVWVASSRGEFGLVTEAETIEALQQKLVLMVRDLLEGESPTQVEIELLTRSIQTLAA